MGGGPASEPLVNYLETANAVAGMDAVRFFRTYGEAFRAVTLPGADPEVAARSVFDLYRRHASQVKTG
ncbi:MAG TPA: hypothetical protein VH092_31300 [Urbifossiella sp.]|nr:hypothetical protein [Urbifossiella sp.]